MERMPADSTTARLRLDKAGLERDLAANPRKNRLSWDYACGAIARNATLDGETTPGWTVIVRGISDVTGQTLTPAEAIRARNRQPVPGFAALLMEAFAIGPETAIAQIYARSEAAALKYGEQLDTSRATMAGMFADENAEAARVQEHTQRQQIADANAEQRLEATRLHVPNPGHVTEAMARIRAAGPTVNRFDSILQAVQGRSR